MVYAKKGSRKTIFKDAVWANMAPDKNDWEQISEAEYNGGAAPAKVMTEDKIAKGVIEIQAEQKYTELYKRASGLSVDGMFSEALELYREAQTYKATVQVAQQIKALEAIIDADTVAAFVNEVAQQIKQATDEEYNAHITEAMPKEIAADEEYNGYITEAERAYKEKDFITALQMYEAAYEIKETPEVKKLIASCTKKAK